MNIRPKIQLYLLLLAWLPNGCALMDDGGTKKPPSGLIATPTSYYSTAKARHLGFKYQDNLDRLTEQIVRNSNTSQLQFANNISSVGGIGFFTHSATKTPDERYLEVVLATPETFETKGEYSDKVNQLFSNYGEALLGVLAGDSEIYQDKELTGYGLNLTWRNVISEAPANRVTMARAIIYFHKERVASFLRHDLNQNELLSDAVIFAVEEDGPLNLVSYQPRETKPDFRPTIREDNLVAGAGADSKSSRSPAVAETKDPKTAGKVETAKRATPLAQEAKSREQTAVTEKPEVQAGPVPARKDAAPAPRPVESVNVAPEKSPPKKPDSGAEQIALARPSVEPPTVTAVVQAEAEPIIALPPPALAPTVERKIQPIEAAPSNEANVNDSQVAKEEPATKQPITDPVEPRGGENSATAAAAKNIGAEPMAVKGVENTATVPPPVKSAGEGAKPKRAEEISRREAVITPAPTVALPARPADENIIAPAPSVAKPENRQPVVAPVLQPVAPARRETDIAKKATEPSPVPAADSTARQTTRPPATIVVAPPVAKNPTPPEAKTAAPPAKEPAREEKDAEMIDRAASPATPAAARPVMPEAGIAKSPEVKAPDATPVRSFPEKLTAKKTEEPKAKFGIESQVTDLPPAKTPTTIALPEKNSEKPVPDQLALLKKPMEPIVEGKPLARQAPKALEGFIIQIAFNDKNKAQNWAEQMEQRGYAVSVTEAGGGGSLRVRLGNFSMRDDAERQLRNFKQQGMSGIIINLPQAFQPEARSSVP